ncbi:alpha-amylase family glycosyl hydrolase [Prevotella jejuni]
MKRILTSLCALFVCLNIIAQGWPAGYGGVMLQGFYWDSFDDSQWIVLEKKANDFSGYFDLVWVPQSGKAAATKSMGYDPLYYFNQNSSFGTEAELRSMITTFKNKQIGTIADVVINHHGTNNGWFGFPAEVYKGVTYQNLSTDVCADDDGGAAATEARKTGTQLSQNNDEGEGWGGMRDLDHKSGNVQKLVKAYENFLLNDLGYAGFRYDMVKGFGASHVGDYNTAANVKYSVGEYWDGNANTVKAWIDATGKRSAAFDFAFRYAVRDAINQNDWRVLSDTRATGLNIDNGSYKQYAVTFVENHDVQDRGTTSGYSPDPIRKDTLAANAYLLAMPGTPCVFYTHYLTYPKEIKAMIDARKLAGVTNTSSYQVYRSSKDYYANVVTGQKGNLLVVVGKGANQLNVSSARYTKLLSGYHYAYYLAREAELPWADKANGSYESENLKVKLVAVSADDNARLVYTLDGSTPTIGSQNVANGTEITLPEGKTILKVAVLSNGKVGEQVLTRTYMVKQPEPFVPQTIRVYVNTDQVNWNAYVNYHSWGGTHTATSWPGDKVTSKTTLNGKTWFYKDYTLTKADDYVNFVFSIGTASNASANQTVDIERVKKTSYFEVSSTKENGKYVVNNVTSVVTGIEGVEVDAKQSKVDKYYYTLSGQRLTGKPSQRGVYIHAGKKIVVK